MRTKTTVVLALLLLTFVPLGARANTIWEHHPSADCEGWAVSGILVLLEDVDLHYEINLMQGSEVVETASGVVTIARSAAAPFSLGGSWESELCGEYTVEGIIYFYSVQTPYDEARFTVPAFTCECDTVEYCNHTPGYWKNHPMAWPVSSLTVGCTTYSQGELLEILDRFVGHDKLLIMVHHLIAAKLNVLAGSDPSIQGAIDDGDALVCALGRIFGAVGKDVKGDLVDIKDLLADYNELGCPGEEEPCSFDILDSKVIGSPGEAAGSVEESTWGAIKKRAE
jgi:hypothetical protein